MLVAQRNAFWKLFKFESSDEIFDCLHSPLECAASCVRNVVEPLRDRKKRCQFIIATHNANIPVLGDAEQIHACREVQKGEYVHQSGSLDCPATSKTIVDIMEGGAEAFLRRQKVLQQWTKSVSDKKS